MTLEVKKELLRYKILHQRLGYNLEVLDLINPLENEIERIDEKSFSFNVEVENNSITAMRFLKYMDEYVDCMKSYFYNMTPLHCILKETLKGNDSEISSLLNCLGGDDYLYNVSKDSIIQENIYKLIICNFIKNANYIPLIEDFLIENKIKLKKINDYTLKESKEILNLLSDIVFCMRGRGASMFLFENIEVNLSEYLKRKSKSKSKKYTLDDFKNKYVNDRIEEYAKIFKAYNNKKKYLRYFL